MTQGRFQLTPYRIKLALDVLAGLVIVSVAFALAGLTWRLAGHAGTGAVSVPVTARPAPPPPDLAPALAFAPFGRGAPGDGAVPTALQIELKGLVFARPAELASAFIAAGSETKTYRVGETIAGAVIEAIEPKRVLLRNNGRLESLAFPDPFAQPAPAPAASPTGAPAPAAAPGPSAPPPPPAVPSAATLMQQFGARPVSGGYQVGDGAPPGLQSGDVVQSLNGASLGSPDAARDALMKAQQDGTAQIQVLRDGKRLTLTVPIR
ncbi:PDZ domain-containing protein [Sphingomonas cannabina]|uniref:type II secretion system protein N n=1 Tax=Sphingomonas cannabina TaxID=2899123 RepID=UPI001F3F0776|nr:type II secretion system protein N [Sphingomonas cannabina]UIJ46779.1 PDZ domain-containing protein [Sphingomonas cannabina]